MKGWQIIVTAVVAFVVALSTSWEISPFLGFGSMVAFMVGLVKVPYDIWVKRRNSDPTKKPWVKTPRTGLWITIVAVGMFVAAMSSGNNELAVTAILFIAPIGLMKWFYDFTQTHKSEKKKAAEARARRLEEERRAAERERRRLATTIVEVKILGGGSTTYKKGGLGGAIVGGMMAGSLGAVVGANSVKGGRQKQRFAVKYLDGHVEIRECEIGSLDYRVYMDYVKWEDIQ